MIEWRCPRCNHLILKHDGRGLGLIETRCYWCKTFITLDLRTTLDKALPSIEIIAASN